MKRLQSKGSLVKSIGKYYAKRHTYRSNSVLQEKKKKTASPYICRMFFDKYKPLDANICFTKTPIPCRMIFKKNKTVIPACIYLSIN